MTPPRLAGFATTSRRIQLYVQRQWWALAVIALLSLIGGFSEAMLLYVVVQMAGSLTAGSSMVVFSLPALGEWRLEVEAALGVGGSLLVLALFTKVAVAWLTATLSTTSLNRARRSTFEAFVCAEWEAQSEEPPGRLQEALSAHVSRIGLGVLVIANGLGAALNFLAYFLSALLLDPTTAVLVLGGVALVGLLLMPLSHLLRRFSRQAMGLTMEYANHVAESVAAARDIEAAGGGERVVARGSEIADRAERAGFRTRFLRKLLPGFYQSIALGLVLIGLAALQSREPDDIAALGAIVLLLVRSLSYTQQLNTAMQSLSEYAPYIENVEELDRTYRARRKPAGGLPIASFESLALEGVTFSYDDAQPVLRDVRFEVRVGEFIGIVGPSGGGKSTLVQLLTRLRSPGGGALMLNGVPAEGYSLAAWRQACALVPQDPHTMTATISDNIRFWRDIDEASVRRAAELAHLAAEIQAMPHGFGTVLGKEGVDLSGGQRQRLGIARALAGDPAFLVLDEPTSALDMRSELLIQETLEAMKGRVTMVVVAHRLSTLSMCDRIVVIESGRVTAVGTHMELMSSSQFFAEAVRAFGAPT